MKNITIKSIRDKQINNNKAAEMFFSKPKDEIVFEEPRDKRKCGALIIIKFILFAAFVLVVGGIGGVLADRFAIPYLLAKYPDLNRYDIIKNINSRTTTIEITKNINITENEGITDAIKKVSPSVVKIFKSLDDKNAEPAYAGNGIVLTSNGYIITSAKLLASAESEAIATESKTDKKPVAVSAEIKAMLFNGKTYKAEIVNSDPALNLAIIKIEEKNLPVLALADSNILKLGERVVVVDDSITIDIVSKFIDDYESPDDKNTPSKKQNRIMIMKELPESYRGATVINIKGEIVGISDSGNLFIPTNELNDFIKSVIK